MQLAPITTDTLDPAPIKMGLVNARSVMNKTFISKDFFISHGLDFLCMNETWMSPGESSAFSELLPPDCSDVPFAKELVLRADA